MTISGLWTRTFVSETDFELEVPDTATVAEVDAAVAKFLKSDKANKPTLADASWDGCGFAQWCQVDAEDEEIADGLSGQVDE